MSTSLLVPAPVAPPVEARLHRGLTSARGVSAATMLTVYLVLLVAIPSNLTLSALGSLGKPALLWGLVLLLWWLLTRLQARTVDTRPAWQPVKLALGALCVIVLVGFAAAMFRGQPADQVSPAVTAIVRLMSWAGVLMVAMDGIRTHNDAAKLIRRLVIAAAALAALGLAQFFAGSSLLDPLAQIPGLTLELGGVDSRGAFTRASGTATHPLEFTAALAGILPLAIATAIAHGYRPADRFRAAAWWTPVLLIAIVAILAVSRSAIIGIGVAVIASIPGLPRAYRWIVVVGGAIAAALVIAVVPGLLGTVVSLFSQAGSDPSALSRTNALARVPEFVEASPFVGQGFGTFLPRYYIFDNQWVLSTVELGVLGVIALAALVIAAIFSAAGASRRSPFEDTKTMSRAVAASVLTLAVLFLFFDGLSFAISAGLFFLMVGLAAAMRTIGITDAGLVEAEQRVRTHAPETEPIAVVAGTREPSSDGDRA